MLTNWSTETFQENRGESLSPEPEPRRVPGPLGSAARLRVSANSENPRIRRAYRFGVRDFTACAGIERPKEVRRVTRVHLIARL